MFYVFLGWFVFYFQELTYAKTSFFAAALFHRSFRVSPSSLKRDVNNAIQSSKSLFANGTVAQSRRSEHLWRTMSLYT